MRPRSTTLIPNSGSMTSLRASVTSSNFSGVSVAVMLPILRLGRGAGFGSALENGREVAVVALVLEAVGELRAALLDDPSGDHDVHEVGVAVAQDAGVVRDQQHTEVGLALGAVDALRHDLERVDVETRVGLVEHGDLRLEQLELQDLVALLLAAGEALVDVSLRELGVHPEVLHGLLDLLRPRAEGGCLAVDGGLGRAEEVRDGDARDLDGVLHREEQTGPRALVDGHRQDVFAVERDRST